MFFAIRNCAPTKNHIDFFAVTFILKYDLIKYIDKMWQFVVWWYRTIAVKNRNESSSQTDDNSLDFSIHFPCWTSFFSLECVLPNGVGGWIATYTTELNIDVLLQSFKKWYCASLTGLKMVLCYLCESAFDIRCIAILLY